MTATNKSILPAEFPPGTWFALYAGLPLTLSGEVCEAWDRPGGRLFDRGLFDSQGSPCSELELRQAEERWENVEYRRDLARHVAIVLPSHFPAGTQFADYEGIPLTALGEESTAWDRPGGRWFNHATFKHRAYRCDEKEFRQQVAEFDSRRMARQS